MTLNSEQQDALDCILKGENVFLTGPGGVGKSFLIQTIVETLTKKERRVAVTALTGCAALLLGRHAKTIHSWAGIGLGRDPAATIVKAIRKYKFKLEKQWILTHTLIIDEVSMMTPKLLELLDEVARLIRRNSLPFGGIQVVLVGDFFQLPPVMKREDLEIGSAQFAFESPVWTSLMLKTITLSQIMRQADPAFQTILHQARWGSLTKESVKRLMERQKAQWQSLEIKPTLLFSRRAEVEMINDRNLAALKGPQYTFEAKTLFDVTIPKGMTEQSPEVKVAIERLDREAPYRSSLSLKEGAQVMLIYNVDPAAGLVNGSRGVVKGFTEGKQRLPLVLFKGHDVAIPVDYQTWGSQDLDGMKRSQIPLLIAYAITIHKCQGSTLDSALVDIGTNTFEVGQAYVALSRVKSLESLYIYDLDPSAFKAHPKVCEFYKGISGK